MILSKDQQKAYDQIMYWIVKKTQPYWRLTGSAGTGKSILIDYIIQNIDSCNYLLATLTWKAALVLKAKGLNANSIHSTFYELDEAGMSGLKFRKKQSVGSSDKYDLIVIDEASMVNIGMREDILSFGIPVLFVGDPQQLPCIEEDGSTNDDFLLEAESRLTQIHRQALDSPIIRMSVDIVQGRFIKYGKYGDGVLKLHNKDVSDNLLLMADQILCAKNDTRRELNNHIRKLKGIPVTDSPHIGEQLIFTKNYKDSNLYNGTIVEVSEPSRTFNIDRSLFNNFFVTHYDTKLNKINLAIKGYFPNVSKFTDLIEKEPNPRRKFALQLAMLERISGKEVDFAYALTVHKFQGSQAEKVCVFFEYMQGMDKDMKKRWLYTAVTRAERKLILVEN